MHILDYRVQQSFLDLHLHTTLDPMSLESVLHLSSLLQLHSLLLHTVLLLVVSLYGAPDDCTVLAQCMLPQSGGLPFPGADQVHLKVL